MSNKIILGAVIMGYFIGVTLNLLTIGMWLRNIPWRNWYVFAVIFMDCIGVCVVHLLEDAK